ncbi:aldo/keto reductase [Leucobacter sp. UT-8R-CII-1-4]|uniref:aldo/keto reductase n=1 Tax=Leucobacter sp. UT-8R-CII-1-4 TaxID=3040075 RepID=UPI0024A8E2AC|nr:aldo/keto reductase [Leucobacter sp. UT-8R-CII-1-4]MDI6022084.1 aldo/keto reductase [Leucobacter sp. UT-8R-CII-1-4]
MGELPVPFLELNDGNLIPQLGLGVWRLPAEDTERVVSEALELGYRHFDTARIYDNEAAVGRALAASGLPREELFVTTKLWNTDQEDPHGAFEASLDRLGLEKVDLYLVHWPVPQRKTAVGAWRGLVEIVGSNQCDSIGVSNFEIAHLNELISETGVVPAVNQVELHPLHQRRELRAFCAERGIAVEAWGPLSQGKSDLLERPETVAAAAAHGKTPAQVVIRWHLQHGTVVFPKTSSRERLAENADVFDFELTSAEMASIDAMDEQRNFGPDPASFNE